MKGNTIAPEACGAVAPPTVGTQPELLEEQKGPKEAKGLPNSPDPKGEADVEAPCVEELWDVCSYPKLPSPDEAKAAAAVKHVVI